MKQLKSIYILLVNIKNSLETQSNLLQHLIKKFCIFANSFNNEGPQLWCGDRIDELETIKSLYALDDDVIKQILNIFTLDKSQELKDDINSR